MANVNSNLPIWSKAFWNLSERDARQDAADAKESQRRLMEGIILQELVNQGRITEQQAADTAAASRQKTELAARAKEAELDRDFRWNSQMLTGGMREQEATADRNLRKWEAEQNLEQQKGILAQRAAEDKTAGAGHMLRAVYGSMGGAEVTDPVIRSLAERIGISYDSQPTIVNPANKAAGKPAPVPTVNIRRAQAGTPPPGETARTNSSAPALPAPTGPAPSITTPQSPDDRLKEEWMLMQKRLLTPTNK